jgi:hypothetical protein
MDKEKNFRHSLGTIDQNAQRILRAQHREVIERIGAPGPTRTGGTRIRNPLLCPPELQGRPFVTILSSSSVVNERMAELFSKAL